MSLARWVVTLAFLLLVSTVSVKANSIYYDITDFHHDSIANVEFSTGSAGVFAVLGPVGSDLDNIDNKNGKDGGSGSGTGSSSDDFASIYGTQLKNAGGEGFLNGSSNGNEPRRIGVSQSTTVALSEPGVLTLLATCMVAAGVLLLKRSAGGATRAKVTEPLGKTC
jgi:hypothetical protein